MRITARKLNTSCTRPLLATLALAVLPVAAPAQRPDSTASTPEGEIHRVWNAYVAARRREYFSGSRARSPYWSKAEQDQWPDYDLATFYAPNDAVHEVRSIRRSSRAGEYELVARFKERGAPDSTAMTLTFFAVREDGRWVLANALPRRTAGWSRHVVGQVTYIVDPKLHFVASRAQRAVAFADSLADAFALPRLGPTEYYVASSVDVAMESLGVRTAQRYGPNGGFSKPRNQQVFSGIPALGENYRHELVHLVLPPLHSDRTTIIASEGAATYFGGSGGMDYRGAVRELAQYLDAHPDLTLDAIMDRPTTPQSVRYATGAVLCELLDRKGGVRAIAAFHRAGPRGDQLRDFLVKELGRSWGGVVAAWRAAVRDPG